MDERGRDETGGRREDPGARGVEPGEHGAEPGERDAEASGPPATGTGIRWAYLFLALLLALLVIGWWVLPDSGDDAAPDGRPDPERVEPGSGAPAPAPPPAEVRLRQVSA